MNAVSVISIGNELLSGQCLDTNRAWLGEQLSLAGLNVVSGFAVSDEISAIEESIAHATAQANIVLITGGIGPTDDDLTRDAVAKFLGVELEFRQELYAGIEDFFAKRNYPMVQKNRVQAYIPAGAKSLRNAVGTAPGFIVTKNAVTIAVMPGVPSEMKLMFSNEILPQIIDKAGKNVVVTKRIKCYGIGESNLNETLGDMLKRGQNPLINCTVNQGVITLHVVANSNDKKTAQEMIANKISQLQSLIGKFIFGYDNETLEGVLGKELQSRGKTIALAESCTGGLIAKLLTDLPGASDFFQCGWVTYSNAAKNRLLGVDAKLLEEKGAVSREVALEMAKGALERSCADVAVAVTGIAGPGGGSEEKPVGLVYIALVSSEKTFVEEFNFPPNREVCRLRTAQKAIAMVRKVFLATV